MAFVENNQFKALAAFRYELRKFLKFSEEAAKAQGVTPQQYQALLAIEGFSGRGEIRVGELAEQLQIVSHSAVGLVDRMEKRKLIKRNVSKQDKRFVSIGVTPLGRSLLEKVAAIHRRELRTAGPLLMDLLEKVERL